MRDKGSLPLGKPANIWLCAVLAVAGNVLLVAALRSTDLSVLGPINAYKAVLSLGLGIVLLREIPTEWGALGILLTVVGSVVVVDRAPGQAHKHLRSLPQACWHPTRHGTPEVHGTSRTATSLQA